MTPMNTTPRASGPHARCRARFAAVALWLVLGAGCDEAVVVPPVEAPLCVSPAECDDGIFCNGEEACFPGISVADARGCAPGVAPCGGGEACDEAEQGCVVDCGDEALDRDGDGVNSVACGGADCDDDDADRFPGNVETCDDGADGAHDEDCDPTTFGEVDADGDGEIASYCCNATLDGLNCGSDCDDDERNRRSGQLEVCDAVDNDCDDVVDEETVPVPWYLDGDRDGFGSADTSVVSCSPVAAHSLLATDCDDSDAAQHPAQLDVCDLADNNCNGRIDELPICGTVTAVPSEGAVLTLATSAGVDVTLHVPAGALPVGTAVSLGETALRALPTLRPNERFAGVAVAVSPFEANFGVPATLRIPTTLASPAVLELRSFFDPTWARVATTREAGAVVATVGRGAIFVLVDVSCDAVPESCNGLDDDCDSSVDEGACVVSVGPPFYPATACTDANPALARVYRVNALGLLDAQALATAGTVGHDVDARGSVCGKADLPGGIDVGAADYLSALRNLSPTQPWSDWRTALSAAVTCAAPTCAPLELLVTFWPGSGCASVGISDGASGRALTQRFGVIRTSAGAFGGAIPALELPIPVASLGGATATLRLNASHVLLTGTEIGGTLAGLVLGGVLEKPALDNAISGAIGLLTDATTTATARMLAEPYLDVALGVGGCQGLSFAAVGSAQRVPCPDVDFTWDHDGNFETACLPWTTCGSGEFVSAPGSMTSDRACAPCASGSFADGANVLMCQPWTACVSGEFEASPASASADRVCRTEQWSAQVGGPIPDDLWDVAGFPDGSVVMAGRGDVPLTSGALASARGFVRRVSRAGAVIWTYPFEGGIRASVATGPGERVALAFDTTTAVAGFSQLGGNDAYIRLLDGDGAELWTRQIATSADELVFGVSIAPDGSVLVVGSTRGVVVGASNAGDEDAFVRRYSATGNVLWTRQLGTTTQDQVNAVDTDAGRVVVAGMTGGDLTGTGALGGMDGFVIELSLTTGATVSGRTIGTTSSDHVNAVRITPDGGVVAAGSTSGMLGTAVAQGFDGFIRRFAPNWSVLWTGVYADMASTGPDHLNGVDVALDGTVLACGTTSGALQGVNQGSDDLYVVRVSANGSSTVITQMGSAGQERCAAISVDPFGYYVAVGSTSGSFAAPGSLGAGDGLVIRAAIP